MHRIIFFVRGGGGPKDHVYVPEQNFTLMGMAGLITGVMHAPLTGIFLIAELTGMPELGGMTPDGKSASNLNGNLNCSKELEHYAS